MSDPRLAAARETLERRYPVESALRAVDELGELALRPGSDLLAIVRALAGATEDGPEPLVAAARSALLDITRQVPAPAVADDGRSDQVPFEALHGLGDPAAFDPARCWPSRPGGDRLRVPLGVGTDGAPVTLDFNAGPHGLIVGAPGSGKSELLRTLILALAVTHSPEELNFVFVDHYGGSTFSALQSLPHVAAMITGIAASPDLVDRFLDTVAGELARRAEPARTAPALFVVVDEFTELLSLNPGIVDLFVQIGRVGRSLGVHQLLASQRLEEGRLRGLDNYLSSRIALRTFTARESRVLVGMPDAFELPMTPGAGYVRSGSEAPVRFRGPMAYHRYWPPAGPAWERVLRGLAPWGRPNVAEVLTERMRAAAPPATPMWLPPLTESPTLGDLLGPLVADPEGLRRDGVPLARVDRPFERRYDVLRTPLDEGNIAIVGAHQSGKSTALQTLALGLALAHKPVEAQLYVLDLGGRTLAPLAGLPHTAAVADRHRRDLVPRIVGELHARLDREPAGRAYLLIDDWGAVRQDFEDLEVLLHDLARRGPAHGIRLVVTARRWAELRPGLRDAFTTRIELRLGDPAESELDRRDASRIPYDLPGRGLTADRRPMMVARPRLAGDGDLDAAVAAIRAAWPFEPVPAVEELPGRLSPEALPEPRRGRIPIGVEQLALRPVVADFEADPHLIVLGDDGSGKTSFLRGLARSIERAYRPEEARIVVLDYRRHLLGAVARSHLIGYCTGPSAAADVLGEVVKALGERVPGRWRGPELFLLVDDYDLVAGAANPLSGLLDLLPRAGDIGLHLVVARRVQGAARAMFEPVLALLRDLSAAGIVLSGPREEGQVLAGVRPEPLPPGRGRHVSRRHGRQVVQLAWHGPPPRGIANPAAADV
ncbi:type VII secretion protein EccCb [Dactylosporangium sp. McL0621]|uniref:type VII secretion protein EccCb n=1 Tax=Dactylosporangium sp. McL0621 TaxID=3415678 RepID=UPI003CEF2D1D